MKDKLTTIKKTSLVVIPSKEELQKGLAGAIKRLDKKLKELGVDSSYVYKCAALFKMNENDSNNINIQNSMDTNYLILALSKMKRLKQEFENTCKELNIKTIAVPKWLNTPIDAWISDLTYRINLVVNQTLITQLTARRADLITFQSAEQRLFESLKDTEELLK